MSRTIKINELPLAKLLAVGAAFTLFLTVVIMLLTPAASGYEISLYGAYPRSFWGLLILGLVLSQLVVLRSAIGTDADQPYWRIGFFIGLLFNAILLFQPYIRGYPYYERADVLTHLGYINIIRQSGSVTGQNIYPNIHQFVLTLAYATGLEPMRVINTVSAVFGLFSMLAFYAVVTTAYDRRAALVSLPFGLVVTGTGYMNPSPYAMSVLLVPFILYLFIREQITRSVPVRVALTVVGIAIVIYHPLTTVFLLIVFVLYSMARYLSGTRLWKTQIDLRFQASGSENFSKILLATGISWYYNFAGIIIRFESVVLNVLNSGRTESTLEATSDTVARTSPELIDVVRIALTRYGSDIVLIALGGLYVAKLLLDRAQSRLRATLFESTFAAGLSAFAVLSVLFLVFNLIVGFGRPAIFAVLFGSLLAGPLVLTAYERFDRRQVMAATTVVLTVLVVVSVFGVFHSPINKEFNQQVTETELDGAEWIIESRERDVPVEQLGITVWRFEDAFTGATNRTLRRDDAKARPPDHFGYQNGSSLGETYDEDQYLIVTQLGRDYYPEVFPKYQRFWRFTATDFKRLNQDRTVSKVYTNGGFDTYTINETGSTTSGP